MQIEIRFKSGAVAHVCRPGDHAISAVDIRRLVRYAPNVIPLNPLNPNATPIQIR